MLFCDLQLSSRMSRAMCWDLTKYNFQTYAKRCVHSVVRRQHVSLLMCEGKGKSMRGMHFPLSALPDHLFSTPPSSKWLVGYLVRGRGV